MAAFFGNIWFLSWMFAVALLVRWFHVAAVDEIEEESLSASASEKGSALGSGKLGNDRVALRPATTNCGWTRGHRPSMAW